jgi:sulfate transport system substrate-binding protein
VAEEYLQFLYSDAGQQLAAKHYFRPRKESGGASAFAQVNLFTIDEVFGGWQKAHTTHFAEGAIFDQIYGKK